MKTTVTRRSQKIVPKVGNELSLRRLQTGLWQNLGSHGKNRTFGPKTELLGPKKRWVLNGHHDLATNGKSCAKKKFPFSQISISLFWPKKNTFRPEYISSSDAYKSKQRKKQQLDWVRYQGHITIPRSQSSRCQEKRPFLRNSSWKRVRCHGGSFFLMALTVPPSIIDDSSKLRILVSVERTSALFARHIICVQRS